MKKKLPFEEALESRLKNLPVPDENASWQAMSRLLDKNDKPKAILLWKKYLALLLFLFLLLAGIWKLTDKNVPVKQAGNHKNSVITVSENLKNNSNVFKSDTSTIKSSATIVDVDSLNRTNNQQKTEEQKNKLLLPVVSKRNQLSRNNEYDDSNDIVIENKKPVPLKKIINQPGTSYSDTHAKNKKAHIITTTTIADKTKSRNVKAKTGVKTRSATHAAGIDPDKADLNKKTVKQKKEILIADSLNHVNRSSLHTKGKTKMTVNGDLETDMDLQKDITGQQPVSAINGTADNTIAKLAVDSSNDSINAQTEKRDTSLSTQNKEDSTGKIKEAIVTKTSLKQQKKPGHLNWSAGIGLLQQIPISKQKFSSYGFNGSKNIMNDYIPSVYLQVEKPSKWFVQAEFGYGRPQMTEALDYSRKTTVDNLSGKLSSNTLQLQKLFYHKLSLSFNYYIIPNLSMGAGVGYNWLYRVISEQQFRVKNISGGPEEITKTVIHAGYTDSFLYKSVPVFMLQANYQWRRFGFGVRYSGDMQPYIKYTKPSGEIDECKNQSLEILLKFRIWKSKK